MTCQAVRNHPVDNSASRTVLVPWEFRTKVRLVSSRRATVLPVNLYEAPDNRFKALPNRFRSDRRGQLGFRWQQSGKTVEQRQQGRLGCSAVDLVLLNLGASKTAGTRAIPSLLAGAEKSFERRRQQPATGRGLLRRLPNALIYWFVRFPFQRSR